METFTASRTFDVPADAAWAIVADYARDPEWRGGVLEMGSDRAGLAVAGAVTRERIRAGGRTYRNDGVVERVVSGERLEWRTTAGVDADGARTVRSLGAGRCEVTLELHLRPHGFDRLLVPLLRGTLAKGLHADLGRLAGLLERSPVDA
jgi:uncharacterized protein YndB with AHSA1/START domain